MFKRITLSVMAAIVCLMSHAAVSSVSDLYGKYIATTSGYQWFNYSTWEALPTGHTVTIDSDGEGGVLIRNLLGYDATYNGEYNSSSKIIECLPTENFNYYFTISDTTDIHAGFKGQVYDGDSIVFDNFTAWYGTTQYIYTGAKVKLQKVTSEWTATGTLTYYSDMLGTTAIHSGETTLTKYSLGDTSFYGLKFDCASANPGEMLFTVENDSIGLMNGQQVSGSAGAWYYYCYDGIYCVWFDTSEGCSSFPATNTKDAGSLTICHFVYDKSTAQTATASGIATFVWGGASGINSATVEKNDAQAIYDLQGRRVSGKLLPGIYVQNGKKFAVK